LKRGTGMVAPPKEIWGAKGCDNCHGSGYVGRIPVFECWKNDFATRQILLEGGSTAALLKELKLKKFRSLYRFGLQMALSGLTTVDMVVRNLYGMGEIDE